MKVLQHVMSCAIIGLTWIGVTQATISIEGVADKKVYADHVSFLIHSAQGCETTARLNGQPVATDRSRQADEPQYYELAVNQRDLSSGVQENQLIRFIVRAAERANTEWGLPVWTPYPPLDSAAAEFAGATLQVIAPAEYPAGLEIPVIARVEDASGNRRGVNGTVTAAGFESHPLQLLRGVGSVLLPAAAQAGTLVYTGVVRSLQTPRSIAIEGATTWQTVSQDLTSSTDWRQNARVRIRNITSNLLTIRSGVTLTIGAGSVIVIDPGVTIAVEGKIVVNGSPERPVVFTTPDRSKPWGGFLFESGAAQGSFTGTIFTASGADASWFPHNTGHGHSHRNEQCLFYVSNGAHVDLTDCFIVENSGQAGHGEKGYLSLTRCLVQKCATGGQYNDGTVTANDSAFIEFPSATAKFVDNDNDAFYLSGGAHFFTNCLIGWTLDDGFDAGDGSEGSVTFDGCWIESCYHEALALSSGPRHVKVANTVLLNCGQGIEAGYGKPLVDADQCLSTANLVGARFGDNYDWTYGGFLDVKDSLLLFNWRDVWGMAFDTWTQHFSQMDIQNNCLSVRNLDFPNNRTWDPNADSDLLVPFLPTPSETVGVGLAVRKDVFDMADFQWEFPAVRLSTFTTKAVSVNYVIKAEDADVDSGTLHFVSGETVKHLSFNVVFVRMPRKISVTLSNPVNAELTGYSTVVYQSPMVDSLIVKGDEWRYFKGAAEPPSNWNALSFDDSSWLSGPTGIGYETETGYESSIATNLTDMKGHYLSVYARRFFSIEDPSTITKLTFSIDYDDGYIAYLNGVEVASRYPPSPVAHDKPASTSNHEACCGTCTPEQIDLTSHVGDLLRETNVLAIQVHNASLSSSDFLFIPELVATIAP